MLHVFNKQKYIRSDLQSAQDQTYTPIEIIVVDDGSTDDSLKKIEQIAASDPAYRVVTAAECWAWFCSQYRS